MAPAKKVFRSIDEYHLGFPQPVIALMETLRAAIREAAPRAEEVISYNMPAFRQNGVLVYYAGYARHIGFYPTAAPMEAFKDELKKYKTSKGAIQFPLDQPIPKALVKKIVKFRVSAEAEKAAAKKAPKAKAAAKTSRPKAAVTKKKKK